MEIKYYIKTWDDKFRTTAGNFVKTSELRADEKLHSFTHRSECDKFLRETGIVRAESWGMAERRYKAPAKPILRH